MVGAVLASSDGAGRGGRGGVAGWRAQPAPLAAHRIAADVALALAARRDDPRRRLPGPGAAPTPRARAARARPRRRRREAATPCACSCARRRRGRRGRARARRRRSRSKEIYASRYLRGEAVCSPGPPSPPAAAGSCARRPAILRAAPRRSRRGRRGCAASCSHSSASARTAGARAPSSASVARNCCSSRNTFERAIFEQEAGASLAGVIAALDLEPGPCASAVGPRARRRSTGAVGDSRRRDARGDSSNRRPWLGLEARFACAARRCWIKRLRGPQLPARDVVVRLRVRCLAAVPPPSARHGDGLRRRARAAHDRSPSRCPHGQCSACSSCRRRCSPPAASAAPAAAARGAAKPCGDGAAPSRRLRRLAEGAEAQAQAAKVVEVATASLKRGGPPSHPRMKRTNACVRGAASRENAASLTSQRDANKRMPPRDYVRRAPSAGHRRPSRRLAPRIGRAQPAPRLRGRTRVGARRPPHLDAGGGRARGTAAAFSAAYARRRRRRLLERLDRQAQRGVELDAP